MRRSAVIGLALCLMMGLIGPQSARATSATRPAAAHPYVRYVSGPSALAARVGFTQGSPLLWESDAEQAADLDGIVRTGAKWVAADFDWPSAEPVQGQYWWGAIDRLVHNARARRLNVLAL